MTGITVEEPSRAEVYLSDEHSDEHTAFIVLREVAVHLCGNVVRLEVLLRQCAEQSGSLCHEERCRYAFSADVAHAEVEPVVVNHTCRRPQPWPVT